MLQAGLEQANRLGLVAKTESATSGLLNDTYAALVIADLNREGGATITSKPESFVISNPSSLVGVVCFNVNDAAGNLYKQLEARFNHDRSISLFECGDVKTEIGYFRSPGSDLGANLRHSIIQLIRSDMDQSLANNEFKFRDDPSTGVRIQKADLTRLIGNTPLIRINVPSEGQAAVYAKCESANLTGSLKDRVVLAILENALQTGAITQDTLIVEGSSGNTGVSLAVIANTLGLKVRIYMQEHRSQERAKLMRYFGAEVVFTSKEVAMSHVWDARAFAAAHPGEVFLLNQHGSDLNWQAHYSTTAEEILRDLDCVPDALVCGIGTGGSLVGIGKRFREVNPDCELIAIEPSGFVTGIEGLLRVTGNSKLPEVYDPYLASLAITVTEDEALEYTRILNKEYAVLSGISSGAVLCGVTKYLEMRPQAGTVVCVFPDRIEKYFSTQLFNDLS